MSSVKKVLRVEMMHSRFLNISDPTRSCFVGGKSYHTLLES